MLKDRYRLERLLGRGGMASVWLGHDEVLDRPVAIKLLADTIASDPEFVTRFRREARVAGGVSHPNLVDVYDYSEAGERPYLVMEFVPGRDLGELIAGDVPVDRDRLAAELLDALAHIHGAGIVHRDVKPQNIVIGSDGTAKLIDFGIALPRDADSLTQTGLVLATKRYAAPEVSEGQPATERSDLYSCGVVLRACGGSGTPNLDSLVNRLVSLDPSRRPASAHQALDMLGRVVDPGERTQPFTPAFSHAAAAGRSRPRQPGEPTPMRVHSRSTSARGRWAAVAAIVAVLGALAAAVLLGGGSGGGSGTRSAAGAPAAPADAKQADAAAVGGEAAGEPELPSAPQPAGSDPALGASLNQEGFELIQAGRPEEAVPLLEESVRAFPAGTEDINYAYALFNLGEALLQSGRAGAAIPVLERRLEIPDQSEVVRQELEAARREAQ